VENVQHRRPITSYLKKYMYVNIYTLFMHFLQMSSLQPHQPWITLLGPPLHPRPQEPHSQHLFFSFWNCPQAPDPLVLPFNILGLSQASLLPPPSASHLSLPGSCPASFLTLGIFITLPFWEPPWVKFCPLFFPKLKITYAKRVYKGLKGELAGHMFISDSGR
jgi:hypothetical protein